jgi:hypothetical protein
MVTRREFLIGAGTVAAVAGSAALLTSCSPEGGFVITAIEAVQSIQTSINSVPLIQGKRTIIRVYVETLGSTPVPNITGVLDVSTVSFPSLPSVGPVTGRTMTAPIHGTVDRGNLGHSLNFELPPDSLVSLAFGSADFDQHRVSVRATIFVDGQRSAHSPSRTATFTFKRGSAQHVQPILLSSAAYSNPTMADFAQSLQGARTRFPIAEGGFTIAAPSYLDTPLTIDITNDAAWYALIVELELPDVILYGCFPGWCPAGGVRAGLLSKPTGSTSTNILGIGMGFPYGSMAAYAASGPGDLPLAQQIFAHEMAHAFGEWHAHDSCGAGIPWGHSPTTTDQPAMDVPNRQLIPAGVPDLMSYCSSPNGPNWPSTVTYTDLLSSVAGISS